MATTAIGADRGKDNAGGVALERYTDATFQRDDKAFYFGNDGDVKIVYDETTDNVLKTSGADIRISDSQQLQIGDGGDLKLYHDGTNTLITNATGKIVISGAGANIELSDTVELQFGDASDLRLTWDGTGFKITGLPTANPGAGYMYTSDAGGTQVRIGS